MLYGLYYFDDPESDDFTSCVAECLDDCEFCVLVVVCCNITSFQCFASLHFAAYCCHSLISSCMCLCYILCFSSCHDHVLLISQTRIETC